MSDKETPAATTGTTPEEILVNPQGEPVPAKLFVQIWVAEDLAQITSVKPSCLEAYATYTRRMSSEAYEHFKGELNRLEVFIPLTSSLGKEILDNTLEGDVRAAPAKKRSI